MGMTKIGFVLIVIASLLHAGTATYAAGEPKSFQYFYNVFPMEEWVTLLKIKTGSTIDAMELLNQRGLANISLCNDSESFPNSTDCCIGNYLYRWTIMPPKQIYLTLRNKNGKILFYAVLKNNIPGPTTSTTWFDTSTTTSSSYSGLGVPSNITITNNILGLSILTEGIDKTAHNIEYNYGIHFTTLYANNIWYNVLSSSAATTEVKVLKSGRQGKVICLPDYDTDSQTTYTECNNMTYYGDCFTCCMNRNSEYFALIKLSKLEQFTEFNLCHCHETDDDVKSMTDSSNDCVDFTDCKDTPSGTCMFMYPLSKSETAFENTLIEDAKLNEVKPTIVMKYLEDKLTVNLVEVVGELPYFITSVKLKTSMDIVKDCSWTIRYTVFGNSTKPSINYQMTVDHSLGNGPRGSSEATLDFGEWIRFASMNLTAPCNENNLVESAKWYGLDNTVIHPAILQLEATAGDIPPPDVLLPPEFEEETTSLSETTVLPDTSASYITYDSTSTTGATSVPETTVEPDTTSMPGTTSVPETTTRPETTSLSKTTSFPETTSLTETTSLPETTSLTETTPVPETTSVLGTAPVTDTTSITAATPDADTTSVIESTSGAEATSIAEATLGAEATSGAETTSEATTSSETTIVFETIVPETTTIPDTTNTTVLVPVPCSETPEQLDDKNYTWTEISPGFIHLEIINNKYVCRNLTQGSIVETSVEEMQNELKQLTKNLTVQKSTLSASIRKKISTTDNRPSAVSIGLVGIVFLSLELGFLVLLDCTYVFDAVGSWWSKFKT